MNYKHDYEYQNLLVDHIIIRNKHTSASCCWYHFILKLVSKKYEIVSYSLALLYSFFNYSVFLRRIRAEPKDWLWALGLAGSEERGPTDSASGLDGFAQGLAEWSSGSAGRTSDLAGLSSSLTGWASRLAGWNSGLASWSIPEGGRTNEQKNR